MSSGVAVEGPPIETPEEIPLMPWEEPVEAFLSGIPVIVDWVAIGTQKEDLRKRLEIAASATRLKNYFLASVDLMKVLARACGHDHLSKFRFDDLSTWDERVHKMTGIAWAGGTF